MFADKNNLQRMVSNKMCTGLEIPDSLDDEDFPEKLIAKPRLKSVLGNIFEVLGNLQ